MKRLILIDGNALVHRAFHALPPNMTAPSGQMTNAVYGFTMLLLKAIKDFQPEYIAATFDLAGPTFRHEEFSDYKAQREKAPDELYAQIPLVKQVLEVLGVPIFEQAGFEADDLIGSIAEKARHEKDLQTIILTGDLDTLQLVEDEKVLVFTARKGVSDTMLYDESAVRERYGLEPSQVVDFKGLKGDPSDNIPGVPGVGDKTASALLQEFGDIANLYKKLKTKKEFKKGEAITAKLAEKLLANEEQAIFSKKLATIIRDVPIEWSLEKIEWKKSYAPATVEKLFRELGFNSLISRVSGLVNPEEKQTAFLFNGEEKSVTPVVVKEKTANQAELAKLKNDGVIYLYSQAGQIFIADSAGRLIISGENISAEVKTVLEDTAIFKRGFELKSVFKLLKRQKITLANLDFDFGLASFLLRSERREQSLADIYQAEFNQAVENTPTAQLAAMPKLYQSLEKKLKAKNLLKVLNEIELPLIPVLGKMELVGIKVDPVVLEKLKVLVDEQIGILEKKIYQLAGVEFNINSPQQLGEVLFDRLQISTKVRKTGGGARSTAASELEKMVDDHPIVELIMSYREMQKIKNTYIDPFPQLINPEDGRIHTTYNQTGAVTGRLSSQDPNLQNIPIRSDLGQEFRKAFVAETGYQLVSLDYSQIELRIMAYLSGDPIMTKAFLEHEDIHTRTAAEIFEVRPDQVSPNMRREAKALNFGILYGMGALGFARSSGVSREQARQFIDKYLSEFSGVANFIEQLKAEAREKGYVETFFGRRRELPEINSNMPQLIAQAERMAVNAPAQGTAADIMKLAMIKVDEYLASTYHKAEAIILLQVHDEMLLEVKTNLVAAVTKAAKTIMQNVWPVDMPIVVDAKVGDNWAELHSLL